MVKPVVTPFARFLRHQQSRSTGIPIQSIGENANERIEVSRLMEEIHLAVATIEHVIITLVCDCSTVTGHACALINRSKTLGQSKSDVPLRISQQLAAVIVWKTLTRVSVTTLLADAGFDTEANHRFARDGCGVRSVNPAAARNDPPTSFPAAPIDAE